MTGQAIAGVLPCIAQIVSVLSVPEKDTPNMAAGQESPKSAFAYFLTSMLVSAVTLAAFLFSLKNVASKGAIKATTNGLEDAEEEETFVGLWTLFRKLRFMALAVFLSFAITMVFPVFTQAILSVHPKDTAPRLLKPACFIPLAFLVWNVGDLAGRLVTGVPRSTLVYWPRTLFLLSILRLVFVPLYLLCNVHGKGAAVNSDAFYLMFVQLLFGFTNGYIGSNCMMGIGVWVDTEEREAAGGFMGLMIVGGLAVGSLFSFFAS
ncbi:MAG: hypothetical protein LQ342_007099 [Letrouitia transgressa]|nr:MAG: hypothetical protein LQ342_007099 [Letrouitia transgressa]